MRVISGIAVTVRRNRRLQGGRHRRIAGGGIGDHAGQGRLDSLVPSNEAGHVKSSSYIAHARSEEHTSELQSLMSTSYAAFCLKKTNTIMKQHIHRVIYKIFLY